MPSSNVLDPSIAPDPEPAEGWFRFAADIAGEGTAARRAWRSAYVRRAVLFDALCAAVGGVLGWLFWFSWSGLEAPPHPPFGIAVLVPLLWVPALVVARTYEQRFLWVGVEEYRRVVATTIVVLAVGGPPRGPSTYTCSGGSWSQSCL